MKVNVLGGQGGVTNKSSATSILINDTILLDAGCVATALSIKEQVLIDTIFISHSHLDHTKDLAFICDNCFGLREKPFEVYASKETIQAIKNHIFNEVIWPDFSILPSPENPIIKFNEISPGQVVEIENIKVKACEVNHVEGSLGFILDDGESSSVFTFDTCETEKIWKLAKEYKNLKAIFSEISFPNNLQGIADASFHHTPASFAKEVLKMPKDIPVYILHLKPALIEQLKNEIMELDINRLNIVSVDKVIIDI